MLWKKFMQIQCVFKLYYNIEESDTDFFPFKNLCHLVQCSCISVCNLVFPTENCSLSFTRCPPFNIHIYPSDMWAELYLAWQLTWIYLLQTPPVLPILLKGWGNSGEHIQVIGCCVPAAVLWTLSFTCCLAVLTRKEQ